MKKNIITTLLLLFALGANAQYNISYSVGYGSYKMNDMKDLLDYAFQSMRPSMPKGLAIVDNFPPYITHTINASIKRNRNEFGLSGSFLTTGGKIAYSDYSGKYIEKLTFTGYRIGTLYRVYTDESKLGKCTLSFFGEVSPAIMFTHLGYKATLDIYEQNIHQEGNDNISTNAAGFSIQPMFGGRLDVTRNISFSASLGYDFELGSKLSTTDNRYRADWSGFRLNGGVIYSF